MNEDISQGDGSSREGTSAPNLSPSQALLAQAALSSFMGASTGGNVQPNPQQLQQQQQQLFQLPIAIAASGFGIGGPTQQQLQQLPQHDALLGPTTSQLPLLASNATPTDDQTVLSMSFRGPDGTLVSSLSQQQEQLGHHHQQQLHQQQQQQLQMQQFQSLQNPNFFSGNAALFPLHQFQDSPSPSTPTALHAGTLANSQFLQQLLSPQLQGGGATSMGGGADVLAGIGGGLQQQLAVRREMASSSIRGGDTAADILSALSAQRLGMGGQQPGSIENRFPPTSPQGQSNTIGAGQLFSTQVAGGVSGGHLHQTVSGSTGCGGGGQSTNAAYGSGTVRIVSGTGYRHITPFPWRLHEMLQALQEQKRDHIASWLPGGTSFKVHNPKVFAESVIPSFFKHSQYKSFQRQLHIYGFQRIDSGMNKGAYFHQFFVRDNRYLCQLITRTVTKPSSKTKSGRSPEAKEENKEDQKQQHPLAGEGSFSLLSSPPQSSLSAGATSRRSNEVICSKHSPPESEEGKNKDTESAGGTQRNPLNIPATIPGQSPRSQTGTILPPNLGASQRVIDTADTRIVVEPGISPKAQQWTTYAQATAKLQQGQQLLQQQSMAQPSAGGGSSTNTMLTNVPGQTATAPATRATTSTAGQVDQKSGEAGTRNYASDVISFFSSRGGRLASGGSRTARALQDATGTRAADDSPPSNTEEQSNTSWDDLF